MFEQFISSMKTFQPSSVPPLPSNLKLAEDGKISIYYAPFDYVNSQAKIVLCGITPGLQQAELALTEAKQQLLAGSDIEISKQKAKETASFGGPMRSNLIALLDHVGVHEYLGLDSCERLFSTHKHFVHYTSALRYPVFIEGLNYSGSPSMLSKTILTQQIDKYLVEEIRALSKDCIYVPLGPKVTQVFDYLVQQGLVNSGRVLNGLPHPSGANAERISYFLGRKAKDNLSTKTNAEQIELVRSKLMNQINCLLKQRASV